jgi:LacI family transcriptional regulator
MAKIGDVAKLAGVSTATVSAVINGVDTVKPKTKRRVQAAVEKLNYQPNLYARSLARGRSGMLGVIVSALDNRFFAEIAQIAETNALENGYQVLIASTQYSMDRLRSAVRQMIGMRVDGLIIMTSEFDPDVLEMLRARKVPVVFEDVGTVDPTTSNMRVDYEGGIQRALRTLVEMGHTRILFVQSHLDVAEWNQMLSIRLRAEAFRDAARQFPEVEASFLDAPGVLFEAGQVAAAEALNRFQFTGVIANCDPIALGLLHGFRRAGLAVPADVSIIGFDDSPECEYTEPQLTSVRIPRDLIGRAAVETLRRMIENGQPGCEIRIPTELVMRESVARPRVREVTFAR